MCNSKAILFSSSHRSTREEQLDKPAPYRSIKKQSKSQDDSTKGLQNMGVSGDLSEVKLQL
jgi:hypothetical protein